MPETETGLFAVEARQDERLELHGPHYDPQLLPPLNQFDKAHCVMLYEQQILSRSEARSLLGLLRKLDDLPPGDRFADRGGLWPQKEDFIIAELGEAIGGRIHTGRSRQDLGATVDRLYLRERVLDMLAQLNTYRQAMLTVSASHIGTIMPSYTWLQPAQCTTFGHYLLSFVFHMERDFQRIARAFDLTNMSPAGAGVQVGTSYDLNRHRVAELLGFQGIVRNTRDAAMNSDYLSELLLSAGLAVVALLRMIEDFTVWHSREFSFLSLDESWYGASSMMPQKRNPIPLMIIRGKSSRIFGRFTSIFSTLEAPTFGLPGPTYLREDGADVAREFIGMFSIAEGIVASLSVNAGAMELNAASSWAQATELADAIVRHRQLSFRTAHHIVAELVALAERAGRPPLETTAAALDEAAAAVTGGPLELPDDIVQNALNPRLAVESRRVFGGTSASDMTSQVEEASSRLNDDITTVVGHQQRIEDAARSLEREIDDILAE